MAGITGDYLALALDERAEPGNPFAPALATWGSAFPERLLGSGIGGVVDPSLLREVALTQLRRSRPALTGRAGMNDAALSRNALCPCGSGLRYKACHGRVGVPPPVPDVDPEAALTHGMAALDRGHPIEGVMALAPVVSRVRRQPPSPAFARRFWQQYAFILGEAAARARHAPAVGRGGTAAGRHRRGDADHGCDRGRPEDDAVA
jgi:hypothetical protein